MNSSLAFRFFRASAFAGLALVTSATACVQDQETLIIERAVWFDDSCNLDASANSLAGMTADVAFGGRLGLGVVVTNQAVLNENSNTFIDDSEIQLLDADVSLSFSAGGVSTSAYNYAIPSNSLSGGESQPILIQIPSDVVDSLRSTMEPLAQAAIDAGDPNPIEILEIEVVINAVKSSQAGNSKLGQIESRAFTFPLEICFGCLAVCDTAENCGGETGDTTLVCPDANNWAGGCGFAQGGSVVAPACVSDS